MHNVLNEKGKDETTKRIEMHNQENIKASTKQKKKKEKRKRKQHISGNIRCAYYNPVAVMVNYFIIWFG